MEKRFDPWDAMPSERPPGQRRRPSHDPDEFAVAAARVLAKLATTNRELAAACEANARAHRHLAERGDASRECRERVARLATQDQDLAAALRDTADAYDADPMSHTDTGDGRPSTSVGRPPFPWTRADPLRGC